MKFEFPSYKKLAIYGILMTLLCWITDTKEGIIGFGFVTIAAFIGGIASKIYHFFTDK